MATPRPKPKKAGLVRYEDGSRTLNGKRLPNIPGSPATKGLSRSAAYAGIEKRARAKGARPTRADIAATYRRDQKRQAAKPKVGIQRRPPPPQPNSAGGRRLGAPPRPAIAPGKNQPVAVGVKPPMPRVQPGRRPPPAGDRATFGNLGKRLPGRVVAPVPGRPRLNPGKGLPSGPTMPPSLAGAGRAPGPPKRLVGPAASLPRAAGTPMARTLPNLQRPGQKRVQPRKPRA